MAKPKMADPLVWGAVAAIVFATVSAVASMYGYDPWADKQSSAHNAGGVFFVGMLAAWVRNLALR